MRSLPKVTFVVEDFAVGSPAQQLLDRFLIGYNRDGQFYSPGSDVELLAGKQDNTAVEARMKTFGLKTSSNLSEAQSVVIVGPAGEHLANLPKGARCFVYGTIATDPAHARQILSLAEERSVLLQAGTAVQGAFQLPVIEMPSRISRALALTYGAFPQAETDAIEALWSLAKSLQAPKVALLTGEAVWRTAYSKEWSDLFAAAFSRSNTIQGDPVKDGRTQDVAGLRFVEKLVSNPRVWLLGAGEVRAAVFVMNGALEDLNLAFEGSDGKVVSTQLYRPPPPTSDHFSALAASIEDFFRQDSPPKANPPLLMLPTVLGSMQKLWREPA